MSSVFSETPEPTKENKKQTAKTCDIVIIDWDDTLFPTSWVQDNGIEQFEGAVEVFQHIDSCINDIVYTLMDFKLLVITNGSAGWIYQCMSLLPLTKSLFELGVLKVVSARDSYAHLPTHEWKKRAFHSSISDIIDPQYSKYNITSIGDSDYEHEALNHLTDLCVTMTLKSVKFMDRPQLNEISSQLSRLIDEINDVVSRDDDVVIFY